jgi:hypothetical protein
LTAALTLSISPASAQMLPNVNLVLEPLQPNGIYKIGERVGWTVHALLGSGYTRYTPFNSGPENLRDR